MIEQLVKRALELIGGDPGDAMTRSCAICGGVLPPENTKYCGRDCQRAGHNQRAKEHMRRRYARLSALGISPSHPSRKSHWARCLRPLCTNTWKEFSIKKPHRHFCSNECKNACRPKQVRGACALCGRPGSGRGRRYYCSPTCLTITQKARLPDYKGR